MTKKPWGGRFKAETDKLMRDFSESVSYDARLAEFDIEGSIAHARMLGARKIIKPGEAKRLIAGLKSVLAEVKAGKLKWKTELEDVHMNVEARLKEKIGPVAGKLHTARSRNDQVALDMRLYFRAETAKAVISLHVLAKALAKQAEANHAAIMPGFTHTRKAQPVLFAHHLIAYVEMFLRDLDRFGDCLHRLNLCPLGAGALAGTTFPISREMAAQQFSFEDVTQNSIDTVSDRDFLLEFAAAAAITMTHLSRLMEEFIWWGLPELGFVELPEAFTTGSSMMPNKQNPDAAELIRGKTGRVFGDLIALLTMMKGTPLSYNRDFQEDKEAAFDAADTLLSCLQVSERLVAGMKVNHENMRRACDTGFVLATDLADYLAAKGLPFREAHEVVGKMVRHCEEKNLRLEDLTLKEMDKFSSYFAADVKTVCTLESSVNRRDVIGGTSQKQVMKQIKRIKKLLGI